MSDVEAAIVRETVEAAPLAPSPTAVSPAPASAGPSLSAAHIADVHRSAAGAASPPPADNGRAVPSAREATALATPEPSVASRVQRSTHELSGQSSLGPERGTIQRSADPQTTPAPALPRVQRAPGAEIIQRDFWDTASAIGSSIMSGAEAVGNAVVSGAEAVGGAVASGARAVGNAVVAGAEAVGDAAVSVAQALHRSDFNDLNATQYLVSAGGRIEAINRHEENGVVTYYRTGSVAVGEGDRPTITPYEEARPMPDGWLPSVTHINGMMVKPNEGLGSALRLQQELEAAGGEALLGADVPSVLYTYSAHRGFVTDLAECVWGKLYQDDDATDRQTQIILDAVANQWRTTVSAHSRGTIKTDNAVRNAHSQISATYMPTAMADPIVHQEAAAAAELAAQLPADPGAPALSAAMLEPTYRRLFARQRADEMATADLDQYVQLIYAGNAVQFPSNSVNLNLVVAGSDPVTIGVGKYFRFATGSKTEMTDVEGGHGFDDNYAATVAGLIIADLEAQQQLQ